MNIFILVAVTYLSSSYAVDIAYRACKFTAAGTEYSGDVTQGLNGISCVDWVAVPKKHLKNLTGLNFPDGSLKRARNRCRNPSHNLQGPWCFTLENDFERVHCHIPFCKNKECKMTGLGVDYAGTVSKSISGKACVKWTAVPSLPTRADRFFHGTSKLNARAYCRNPTEDINGPWCYVFPELSKNMTTSSFVAEQCDIPSCYLRECTRMVGSRLAPTMADPDDQYHVLYSSLNNVKNNVTFSVKLWDPGKWKHSTLTVAVTVTPVPATGKMLEEWGTGFEVIVRNIKFKTGKDNATKGIFLNLLSGVEWKQINIEWNSTRAKVYKNDLSLPVETHKINYKYLDEKSAEQLQYISVMGSAALVEMNCNTRSTCTEFITNQYYINTVWQLENGLVGRQLTLYLRSMGSAVIHFLVSDFETTPSIQLKIGGHDDVSRLIMVKKDRSEHQLGTTKDMKASYWKWSKLYILIALGKLKIFAKRKDEVFETLSYNGYLTKLIKSFSIGSNKTTHWTIYCAPSGIYVHDGRSHPMVTLPTHLLNLKDGYLDVPDPIQPECSMTQAEVDYSGSLWVTEKGHACLPWTGSFAKALTDTAFVDESKTKALNLCRNPSGDKRGPYCYTMEMYSDKYVKEHCKPQKCLDYDCKISGIGNDFIGEINTTVSGRPCQPWDENKPHKARFHKPEQFPDRSVERASNWCRNPSQDPAGPWCYTVDPLVTIDLCSVPDCFKPDERTVIIKGKPSRRYYVSPDMHQLGMRISVKIWDPASLDVVIIYFYLKTGQEHYELVIGSNNNEVVELIYIDSEGNEKSMWRKSLGYLLSPSKWVGLWMFVQPEQIVIKFKGFVTPTFVCPLANKSHAIEYWSLGTQLGNAVGFHLDKNEHYIEELSPIETDYVKLHRVRYWKPNIFDNRTNFNEFKLFLCGPASAITVEFLALLNKSPRIKIVIDGGTDYKVITIHEYVKSIPEEVKSVKTAGPATVETAWTEFVIMFNETDIKLYHNGTHVIKWTPSKKMLLYYFTIKATKKMLWTANEPPFYGVGKVTDGGWSDWRATRCSASCGGGVGIRLRTCTSPPPSLGGRPCVGPDMEKSRCNKRKCGTLSDASRKYFQDILRHSTSLRILRGESLDLTISQKSLDTLRIETPESKIRWAKNGVNLTPPLPLNSSDVGAYSLIINNTGYAHSGTYMCFLSTPSQKVTVIRLYAVSIYSTEPSLELPIGAKFHPDCKSEYLLYLYNKLEHVWVINQTTEVMRLSVEKYHYMNNEYIKLNKYHTGVWECLVTDHKLNLTWLTNWIYLEVYNPLHVTRLLKMLARNTHLGVRGTFADSKAFIIFVVLLTIIIVAIFQITSKYWIKLSNHVPWWEREGALSYRLEKSKAERAKALKRQY